MNNLKIGDTVRFLNDIGGGTIVRIDEKTKLVHVEDNEGFEIPVLPQECVVVNNIKGNNFPGSAPVEIPEDIPAPQPPVRPLSIIETPDGDRLRAILAFVPCNIKTLQTTANECHIVNDSNYHLYYNIISLSGNKGRSLLHGQIEPNMQERLCTITKDELNDWERIRIQIIPFKAEKQYEPQNVIDFELRISGVKFYKLHSFRESEYFDIPTMEYDLLEESARAQFKSIPPENLRNAMLQKEQPATIPHPQAGKQKKHNNEPLEVDLHINQLLDNTNGMDNAAMLAYQMETFHKTLAEHAKERGRKIIFIHGKGEGVLRKEIEKALKTRYKNYTFQDASFREYGFGATLVTIR